MTAALTDLNIDGVLEISSDGTAQGTTVSVDGKKLSMVQSLAFQVTPEGVVVRLVALAGKATLRGRIASLEKADPVQQDAAQH